MYGGLRMRKRKREEEKKGTAHERVRERKIKRNIKKLYHLAIVGCQR